LKKASPYFARFLITFSLVLFAGIAAIIVFVGAVDPYGLYGLVNRPNFNAVKPALNRYQAEIKQDHAARLQPRFVILGNSRAEIGFDPKAPVFATAQGSGYNLAIPGTGLSASARQFAQLVESGVKPQTAILGVEFIDFLSAAAARPARVAANPTAPARDPKFWRFDALFSLASVMDAIRTLQIQHNGEAAVISPEGFNPLKDYYRFARDDGYYKIFTQRAQESAATFRSKSTTVLEPEDFGSLHTFLLATSDINAEVKLVIYPYHAQMLALFEAAGLWPLFEEWKRRLVAEIANVNRTHPSARITLIDFSGFGPYNCERIPGDNERGVSTTWYWEAGHFKKALGDVVLDHIMSERPQLSGDAVFGIKLDAATQEANIARIASERAACAAAHPELFISARKLFDKRS
jgi:hypothetical protein